MLQDVSGSWGRWAFCMFHQFRAQAGEKVPPTDAWGEGLGACLDRLGCNGQLRDPEAGEQEDK